MTIKTVKRTKQPWQDMPVGQDFTTNDGNDCEAEVCIIRVAERYDQGNSRFNESYTHVEFELAIQTPENDRDPDLDFPENLQKIRLSRDNLIRLQGLLENMDLEQDTPKIRCEW